MKKSLPDIASHTLQDSSFPLQWVGMEKISIPIKVAISGKKTLTPTAIIDCFVSLDSASVKGIHMSRLYSKINEYLADQILDLHNIYNLLEAMLMSHSEMSQSAMVVLMFDLPLQRKALTSEAKGYQSYPVTVRAQSITGHPKTEIEFTIPYCSTCPCSASLARHSLRETIFKTFQEDHINKTDFLEWIESQNGSFATPHSQRSYAYVKSLISQDYRLNICEFITQLEQAIGTPLQTSVTREDEKAFAKLIGANLMFCEDVARRVKQTLESLSFVENYWYKIEHQESLHAHNAVVIDQKHPTIISDNLIF